MSDATAHAIARNLPTRVQYWTYIVVGAALIESDEVVTDVTFIELLQRQMNKVKG